MTAEDQHTILRLLAERRDDLAGERTRILNRLHGLLRGLRPATATVACRRELARDLLSNLRRVDARLTDNKARRVWHHPARQRPLGEGIARCHRWSGSGSSL